jgi:hypothetical protein
MLPSFPLCRIHLAEKRVAVVSELLAGKSQMKTIARAFPAACCGVSEHNNR